MHAPLRRAIIRTRSSGHHQMGDRSVEAPYSRKTESTAINSKEPAGNPRAPLTPFSHRPVALPKGRRAFLRLLADFRFASFEPVRVRGTAQIPVAPQCAGMSRTFA